MSKDNSSEWSVFIFCVIVFVFGITIGIGGTRQTFRKDAVLKGHAHWAVDAAGNTTFEWNQLVSSK